MRLVLTHVASRHTVTETEKNLTGAAQTWQPVACPETSPCRTRHNRGLGDTPSISSLPRKNPPKSSERPTLVCFGRPRYKVRVHRPFVLYLPQCFPPPGNLKPALTTISSALHHPPLANHIPQTQHTFTSAAPDSPTARSARSGGKEWVLRGGPGFFYRVRTRR